ncbi:MAG: hypothetical protein AAFX94_05085, partial [Myxococcota bacterium]
LDALARRLGEQELELLAEEQFSLIEEEVLGALTLDSELQENFVRKLARKARKVARRAAKAAKKAIGKVVPIGPLLKRLRRLVRPLLNRVLRSAIGSLPASLRPTARRLAKRVLGQGEVAGHDELAEGSPAAASPVAIAREFDLTVAGAALNDGEDVVEQYELEAATEDDEPLRYETARASLLNALSQGADVPTVEAELEGFVSAILPLVRTGIRMVGRDKIVSALAKMLAPLVVEAVGNRGQAQALSRAIVDRGLKMMSLELGDVHANDTSLALEATVDAAEQAVTQLLLETGSNSDEPSRLLGETAFREAMADQVPNEILRQELRRHRSGGTWVRRPSSGRRRYKKFSRVFDVSINPQVAQSIQSFGGSSLYSFLKDVMGQDMTRPVAAKVHLYEAVRGTTLSRLTRLERGVWGLGSGRRSSWMQIHPLTESTAGLLFSEPGLGKDVASRWLSSHHRINVGQRFFYLEIPGARPLVHAPRRRISGGGSTGTKDPQKKQEPVTDNKPSVPSVARPSTARFHLDLGNGQARLSFFFSERSAQEISEAIQKGRTSYALGTLILGSMKVMIRSIQRDPTGTIKLRAPGYLKVAGDVVAGGLDVASKAADTVSDIAGDARDTLGNAADSIRSWWNSETVDLTPIGDVVTGPELDEEAITAAAVLSLVAKALGDKLLAMLTDAVGKYIEQWLLTQGDEWVRAQADPADGVTLQVHGTVPVSGNAAVNAYRAVTQWAARDKTIRVLPGKRL